MTDTDVRIVFMGTPDFAVASLHAIYTSGYTLAAVVTVPDKPAGRGQKIQTSPVKDYAVANNLPLMQPEKLRDAAFLAELEKTKADIFVVVAFRMLPEEVWRMPRLGTFNLHASLLPQYRGAAPVNHAIINGESETGVTTFLIDREIDTGKILMAEKTSVGTDENAGEVHDRLMTMGAGLVLKTIEGLVSGQLQPQAQSIPDNAMLHQAPKIFPPDTVINWDNTNINIHNKIRGLSPYPGATTTFVSPAGEIRFKIYESKTDNSFEKPARSITVAGKNRLFISCGKGNVEILSLKAEGRKRITAAEFLRGTDISSWSLT